MRTRVLSALIMAPLLLIVFFGGYALLAGCFIIGIMSVREFFNGFRKMEVYPSHIIAYTSAAALYLINILDVYAKLYSLWFYGVILASLLYLFKDYGRKPENGAATLIGIFYVIFFSFNVALIDQLGNYSIMVWLVFITAFGTDIMAYFTGCAIGKHKLCPEISPKKTVEGSIGGLIGSVILCGAFGYFFTCGLLYDCLILGALGGVLSQLGDLTASIFKRKMGIKDFGNLIPGHGGVLDRFDSVLFTAPMVYYYVTIIIV